MTKPIFQFKSFIRLLLFSLTVAVVGLLLNYWFDISFQTMKWVLLGVLAVCLIIMLVLYYQIERQTRALTFKELENLQIERNATQRMEKELELLLHKAKKAEHANQLHL
jgi:DMSO reductase anchor subunit